MVLLEVYNGIIKLSKLLLILLIVSYLHNASIHVKCDVSTCNLYYNIIIVSARVEL